MSAERDPGQPLRIGSRGSALARWQAEQVRRLLQQHNPGRAVEIVIIRTTGDRVTDVALSRIGDRGLFTKELDLAILDRQIDLAVHSLKDLPTQMTEGLELAAVLERGDARDALLVAAGLPTRLQDLPYGARVGTSSLRRRAQLLAQRADLVIEDLRGNLDTRVARLTEGRYDAIVLAVAGLQRLQLEQRIAEIFETPAWLPAAGQGALAVTTRAGDRQVQDLMQGLEHKPTRAAVTAERAFLHALEGGCQVPIGGFARVDHELVLDGIVVSIDGQNAVRGSIAGAPQDAEQLGRRLAQELLERGAREILNEIRNTQSPAPAAP